MIHIDVTIEDCRMIATDFGGAVDPQMDVLIIDNLSGLRQRVVTNLKDFNTVLQVAINGDDNGPAYDKAHQIVKTWQLKPKLSPIP